VAPQWAEGVPEADTERAAISDRQPAGLELAGIRAEDARSIQTAALPFLILVRLGVQVLGFEFTWNLYTSMQKSVSRRWIFTRRALGYFPDHFVAEPGRDPRCRKPRP